MISPARMERIWKACPELRPFDLQVPSEGIYCFHIGGKTMHHEVASALIRDRCMWWAAERGGDDGVFLTRNSRGFPQVCTCRDGVAIDGDSTSDDPTEACLNMVERLLGLAPWPA